MNDRQEKIYSLLNESGSLSIEQLKKVIFASEATLRRDLARMERDGFLIRTWGGAVSKSNVNSDPPLFVRSNSNVKKKDAIAKTAASFLKSNSTVFLASGTTVSRLAPYLQKCENLTVITNGIYTAEVLKDHHSAKVILSGGELHENYDIIGTIAESTIEQFNADLFFFSCSGITSEGFTSMDMARLNIIKKMKRNSTKTILLVDSSKVGKRYTYKGFGFDDIDYVVMDSIPTDKALCEILGERLIIAHH